MINSAYHYLNLTVAPMTMKLGQGKKNWYISFLQLTHTVYESATLHGGYHHANLGGSHLHNLSEKANIKLFASDYP